MCLFCFFCLLWHYIPPPRTAVPQSVPATFSRSTVNANNALSVGHFKFYLHSGSLMLSLQPQVALQNEEFIIIEWLNRPSSAGFWSALAMSVISRDPLLCYFDIFSPLLTTDMMFFSSGCLPDGSQAELQMMATLTTHTKPKYS